MPDNQKRGYNSVASDRRPNFAALRAIHEGRTDFRKEVNIDGQHDNVKAQYLHFRCTEYEHNVIKMVL